MSKKIAYGKTAKEKLLSGAQVLADAVGSTLGPKGQNVLIDRGYDVIVVHDGVTVAQSIDLKDPEENAGVKVLRQAANKQVDEVGDGTTVVTILGNEIFKAIYRQTTAGVSAMQLRREIEDAAKRVVNEIDKIAKPVKTREQVIQVATISSADTQLGELIGDIVHKVGSDGVITVDESKGNDTYIEHQPGMQFDAGYASQYFITDPKRMEATVENAHVFVTDQTITSIFELKNFIESISDPTNPAQNPPIIRNLVFIAPEFGEQVLGALAANKLNGILNVSAIKLGGTAPAQKEFLQDICILTGAKLVSKETGTLLTEATKDILGLADRITSTKDATLIVGGKGDPAIVSERVTSLKAQLARAEGTQFEIEKLRERIAKLTGGVAVVKVGGPTEVDMKERKERAIDAVAATQAAVEQGIVAGGETVYLRARKVLGTSGGEGIVKEALLTPFQKLLTNADIDPGEALAELKLTHNDAKEYGVDVMDGTIKNLIEAGILDPVKVSKCAIRNGVSVGIQLATSGYTITEEPKKEKTP